MSQHHESIAGLATAWAATIASWINTASGVSVNSILTGVLTITTILWTIERTRTERAKRRMIEGYAEEHPGVAKRLIDRIRTGHGKLDE